jgi:hypothetical protein
MVHLIVLGVVLGLSLRWRLAPLAALALLFAGIELRFAHFGVGFSDVLTVVRAAIEHVQAGGNPYGIGYEQSVPPGAPYPYGPLGLLWYLPVLDEPRKMEMAVAVVVLVLLALRGRLLGLAIYACAPILLSLTSDGSNDTSSGLLLLAGLVLVGRLPRAGAVVLGLAVAFKPHALAWAPPLIAWLGWPILLPLLVGAGLFWVPALLIWGLGNVLLSITLSDQAHGAPYYSLGMALQRLGVPIDREELNLLRLVAGGLTALAVMLAVRTHRGVIVGGTLVFLATLFAGFWSTFAYFAAIAPVVCWYIDDWLGARDSRALWPGDPVGRLEAAIDRRWPRIDDVLAQAAADPDVESRELPTSPAGQAPSAGGGGSE